MGLTPIRQDLHEQGEPLIAERDCSLIIPAYNEEKRIMEVLHSLAGFRGVILCISDGTDRTPEIVRDFATGHPEVRLRLLTFPRRLGKGGAVLAGMKAAETPFIGFTDADGSTPPSQMILLFTQLMDCDAAIGSRWVDGAVIEKKQGLVRRVQSRVFNLVVRILFGLPFHDTQCGAKTFRREALASVIPAVQSTGFAFDVELLWRLRRGGYCVREIPIEWADHRGSKVEIIDAGGMLVSLLRVRIRGP
jgi:glycosyltransferase involved in cell wall biosynthesis